MEENDNEINSKEKDCPKRKKFTVNGGFKKKKSYKKTKKVSKKQKIILDDSPPLIKINDSDSDDPDIKRYDAIKTIENNNDSDNCSEVEEVEGVHEPDDSYDNEFFNNLENELINKPRRPFVNILENIVNGGKTIKDYREDDCDLLKLDNMIYDHKNKYNNKNNNIDNENLNNGFNFDTDEDSDNFSDDNFEDNKKENLSNDKINIGNKLSNNGDEENKDLDNGKVMTNKKGNKKETKSKKKDNDDNKINNNDNKINNNDSKINNDEDNKGKNVLKKYVNSLRNDFGKILDYGLKDIRLLSEETFYLEKDEVLKGIFLKHYNLMIRKKNYNSKSKIK